MPNKTEHQITSAAIALFLEGLRQQHLKSKGIELEPLEVFKCFIAAAIGGAQGGMMPDILEPSTGNPNHRAFCHSVTSGTAIGYGVSKLPLQIENKNINLLNVYTRSCGVGYIAHLALDAGTPKSLKLI